jgi:hypothetical protein
MGTGRNYPDLDVSHSAQERPSHSVLSIGNHHLIIRMIPYLVPRAATRHFKSRHRYQLLSSSFGCGD